MTWGANTKTASSQSERIIMHSSRISEMLQNCNPGLNTLRKGSTVWSPAAQMALPSWLFDRYFLFALIGSSLLCFDILFKLLNFQDVPFFTFPDTTVATTIFLAVGAKVERVNKKKKLESINNFALPEWSNCCSWVNCLGSECSSGITNSSLLSSSSISSTSSPESSCPSSSELRFLKDTKIKQPTQKKCSGS